MSLILDNIINVSRLTKDSDNSQKESYVDNAALMGVKINLQPASPESIAISEGVFGQTYIGFTTESGLKSGDKVTVSGTGEVFRIKGIEDWGTPDLAPHYEITLLRWEEEEI